MNGLFSFAYRGSAIAAIAFLALAPACSDDSGDDDENGGAAGDDGSSGKGGSGGKGGSAGKGSGGSSGGKAGSSGSGGSGAEGGDSAAGNGSAGESEAGGAGGQGGDATGGTSPGGQGGAAAGADAGGAGGADSGDPAVAKFCNTLSFGTEGDPMDTTMVLEIGEGSEKVTFTAVTGNCAPPDGQACTPVPTGSVRVQLFDADDLETALDDANVTIPAGTESIFYSDLDEESGQPVWLAGSLEESLACEDFTYDDL